MAQCFPEYATDYPDLMKALKKMVTDGYNERVPVSLPVSPLPSLRSRRLYGEQQAWKVVTDSCDFVDKANELDTLLAEAEERKQRGEPPEDMWLFVRLVLVSWSRVGLILLPCQEMLGCSCNSTECYRSPNQHRHVRSTRETTSSTFTPFQSDTAQVAELTSR